MGYGGKMGKWGNTDTTGTLRKWKTEKPKVKKWKLKKSREKKWDLFSGPGQRFWSLVLKSKEIAFLMKFDLRSLIFGVN